MRYDPTPGGPQACKKLTVWNIDFSYCGREWSNKGPQHTWAQGPNMSTGAPATLAVPLKYTAEAPSAPPNMYSIHQKWVPNRKFDRNYTISSYDCYFNICIWSFDGYYVIWSITF